MRLLAVARCHTVIDTVAWARPKKGERPVLLIYHYDIGDGTVTKISRDGYLLLPRDCHVYRLAITMGGFTFTFGDFPTTTALLDITDMLYVSTTNTIRFHRSWTRYVIR